MTNAKWKAFILHVAGSIAFLGIPILVAPHPPEQVNYVFSKPTLRDLIANALMLLFFYLHYYFLISKVYFKKRYILYCLIILVAFLLICLLPSLLTGHSPWQPHEMGIRIEDSMHGGMPVRPQDASFIEEIKHHIFLFAVVILFSLLLMIRDRLFRSEREKYQAEVAVLKAQINPHFLFNTMNGIYAFAIREKASVTASS
ncbi:MAG TPA: histidine kinase, partial [Cyclobacteriaceae bacterium]